jgi:hypothetical protein
MRDNLWLGDRRHPGTSAQFPDLHFGLDSATVERAKLVMTNGQRKSIAAPKINSVVQF